MTKLPKGFPKDGMTLLSKKEYITHVGLVWLVNERGSWNSSIDHVERVFGEDGMPIFIEVTVTVSQGDQSHTAIGDASIANVGKMISTALPRMAHTRALNRALRALVGHGATTAEEMGDDQKTSDAPRTAKAPAPIQNKVAPPTPVPDGMVLTDPQCPACNSKVYDNRNDPDRKPRSPLWKCSNRECDGGKGGYSWASWDEWPHEFAAPPPEDSQEHIDPYADDARHQDTGTEIPF